jgi:hypothetical protein
MLHLIAFTNHDLLFSSVIVVKYLMTKKAKFFNTVLFFCFLCTLFNCALSVAPQDYIVPNDAGIEPRTLAILA